MRLELWDLKGNRGALSNTNQGHGNVQFFKSLYEPVLAWEYCEVSVELIGKVVSLKK